VKKSSTILVLFAVACWSNGFAQHPDWENYTNGQLANVLLVHGNELWIGAFTGGLIKLDKTTEEMTFYNHANSGLPHNDVYALAVDGSDIWIGTWGGLAKFDGSSWTEYNTSNSVLRDNEVNAFAIDDSSLWIGTWAGLYNFDGINWKEYNTYNSNLPHNRISCLAIDDSDNIWIGTGKYWDEEDSGQYMIPAILPCLITTSRLSQ
jgi:ligand-binding sensor domain-containing protein